MIPRRRAIQTPENDGQDGKNLNTQGSIMGNAVPEFSYTAQIKQKPVKLCAMANWCVVLLLRSALDCLLSHLPKPARLAALS